MVISDSFVVATKRLILNNLFCCRLSSIERPKSRTICSWVLSTRVGVGDGAGVGAGGEGVLAGIGIGDEAVPDGLGSGVADGGFWRA